MSTNETAVAIRFQDLSPEYAEIMVLGKVLQASGYFKDVRDQAQAVTKILCGRELGFSPIVSMQGIHIIEGKPALSSNLLATLIKRSGKYDYRVKTWSTTECVLTFKEKIMGRKSLSRWEEVGESVFTMDDAKAAGVVRPGGSWAKYPRAMLFARALSQGIRTYCPDVTASPVYVPEEMGADVNEDGDVTQLPKSARNMEVLDKDIVLDVKAGKPPAETITEDIEIGASAIKAAAVSSTQGHTVPPQGPKPIPTARAVKPEAPTVPPPVATSGVREASGPEPEQGIPVKDSASAGNHGPKPKGESTRTEKRDPASPLSPPTTDADGTGEQFMQAGLIESGADVNFARRFKDSLRPAYRKRASEIEHAWLKSQGIVGPDGEGTAKAIRKESFYDVREAGMTYAASYEE